jgi:putative spermidine/putrescine transport system permease protein
MRDASLAGDLLHSKGSVRRLAGAVSATIARVPAAHPAARLLAGCAVNAALWIGLLLIFLPLALTAYLSIFADRLIVFPPSGYTLGWYRQVLPTFGGSILTSLEVALLGVGVAVLFGVPAGVALARGTFPGRGFLGVLLLAPLTVSSISLGLAIYLLAIAAEVLSGLALAGSFSVLMLAHALVTLPWVIRLSAASLVNQDRAPEEAAASLGARPILVFWRVTLPAMRQGIMAAVLFALVISFGELEMTIFLVSPGVTTLPVAVLQYLEYHIDPLVSALAVLQMLLVGLLLLLLDRRVRLGAIVQ